MTGKRKQCIAGNDCFFFISFTNFFKALTISAAKQIISQQQQDENNQDSKHYIRQKNHNCHSHCNPKQNKSYQPFHAITKKRIYYYLIYALFLK
jgi:hypothetical protein